MLLLATLSKLIKTIHFLIAQHSIYHQYIPLIHMLDQVVIKHEKLLVINVVAIQHIQSNTNKFTAASFVVRSILDSL